MYYVIFILLMVTGTLFLPTGSSFVTYDCLDLKEKELFTEIWNLDKVQSLTVQNCETLVLNISLNEGIKSSLQYLTVRNVRTFTITGNGCCGTSLPSHTNFTDVKNMKVEVPLYGEGKFTRGVLQFTNVTIKRLKSGTVAISASSLKKFSMRKVAVIIAEKGAFAFNGSIDSLLEIEDSVFYSVEENFINCNVTKAIIQSNLFMFMKERSFSLEATIFSSLGNDGIVVEDCAVRLHSRRKHTQHNGCSCAKNGSFNEKICVGLATKNTEERTTSSLEESSFSEILSISALKTVADNYKNSDYMADTGQTQKRGKVSTFVIRLGNRFFLLWFLAIFLLGLMFPIAYFTKIFLCRIIDKVFPLDIEHKLLINMEDI